MKKLLLIAVAAAVIVGCKKSSTKPSAASINGKWSFVTDTANSYLNGVLQESEPVSHASADYVQFNSDGTGTSLSDGAAQTFTYSISGTNLTVKIPTEVISGTTYPAVTQTAVIRTLTSANLTLFFTESETDAGQTYKITDAEYLSR